MSLRTRIALLVASAVAVAVVLISAVTLWAARAQARAAFDHQIQVRAETLLTTRGRLPRLPERGVFGRFVPHDVLVQVIGARGQVIYRFGDELPVTSADLDIVRGGGRSRFSDRDVEGVRLRFLTTPMADRTVLMVARPLTEIDENLAGLRNAIAVIAVLGVVASGLAGFVVAGSAIRPVRRLTETVNEIARTQDIDRSVYGSVVNDPHGASRRLGARGPKPKRRGNSARGGVSSVTPALAGADNAVPAGGVDALAGSDARSAPSALRARSAAGSRIRRDELGELAAGFDAMLEALARSRAQQRHLVADAGHELRTPLTSIRTNIELLARTEPLPADDLLPPAAASAPLDDRPVAAQPRAQHAAVSETGAVHAEAGNVAQRTRLVHERRRMLDDVLFELDELTVLVNELVDLAADRRDVGEPVIADFAEIVEGVVERHRRRAPHDITLRADRSPIRVVVPLAERAVSNIIDNAVKWSPPDRRIEVTVADGVLRVRDHGPGIPPAERELVFERFYRSDEARSTPGSGLGLSIVAHVAEMFGGAARVVGTLGSGATVELRLPLAHPDESRAEVS